ncbi:MAG: HDOD domain-containing protein [Phycisphaerales bacterium]|nr:HDOD domain-containing protein [Phycisphaerales bacterium]
MRIRKDLDDRAARAMIDALTECVRRCVISTQPEVVSRILTLVEDPDAQINQFAEVIRTDAALTGRLLKLANSAHFSQRGGVTTIERACVLIGLDRIRSLSLGFYLSRSAGSPTDALARRIWGESVYRACLMEQLADHTGAAPKSEAFLVGLVMDSGVPLMPRLVAGYAPTLAVCLSPTELYEHERSSYECTHADVGEAIARVWNLPEVLSSPIARHHTEPALGGEARTTTGRLHLLAYYAGAVRLQSERAEPVSDAPAADIASMHLGIDAEALARIVRESVKAYRQLIGIFSEVADTIEGIDRLAERSHRLLNSEVDRMVLQTPGVDAPAVHRVMLGGSQVELHSIGASARAYLCDSQGRRLVAYEFTLGEASAEEVAAALGLHAEDASHAGKLEALLDRLAA